MPRINVLDKHTAELIAAGEVVERPASAIKELVENSIDAGASAITVEIKNGGNTFMRVTDNGCGIHPDDIKIAFLRHATSKIADEDDLNAIFTLGFRGEALASISAVAKVELLTRTEQQQFGMRYVIHGGEEVEFEQAGCALGTTIIARDLFYNTPARMKFLKKDNTESNAVTAMLERIAVSHPDISFKLIRDSKQVMNTPGDGKLHSAVFSVFGKDFADGMLPVEYEMNGVSVSGMCCKPTESRKNRNMQFFFLNGRYIKTKTAMAALEQAYKNSIMVGKFPSCVLNLKINPAEVDVNVHPAKIEVRFSDEKRIFSAVYYAVKSALSADSSRVSFTADLPRAEEITRPPEPKYEQMKIAPSAPPVRKYGAAYEYKIKAENKPAADANQLSETEIISYGKDKPTVIYTPPSKAEYAVPNANTAPAPSMTEAADNTAAENSEASAEYAPNIIKSVSAEDTAEYEQPREHIDFKYVGQAFETYIIVECDNKLILIDKHAAHERILFEQIKETVNHEPQMLLAPIHMTLSAAEYDAVCGALDNINAAGFEIEEFGVNTLLVRGVPMSLDGEDVKGLIGEIAGRLMDKHTDFSPEFLDWLYHSVACRAAIKAGNKSSAEELCSLADIVLNDDRIRYCPHGRPVAAELSKNEIMRRFSRI